MLFATLDGTTPTRFSKAAFCKHSGILCYQCGLRTSWKQLSKCSIWLEKEYGENGGALKYTISYRKGLAHISILLYPSRASLWRISHGTEVTTVINGSEADRYLNDEERGYYEMACKSLDGVLKDNNWHQLKMYGPGGALGARYLWQLLGFQAMWWMMRIIRPQNGGNASTLKTAAGIIPILLLRKDLDKFDSFIGRQNQLGGRNHTEKSEWLACRTEVRNEKEAEEFSPPSLIRGDVMKRNEKRQVFKNESLHLMMMPARWFSCCWFITIPWPEYYGLSENLKSQQRLPSILNGWGLKIFSMFHLPDIYRIIWNTFYIYRILKIIMGT